MWQKGFFTEGFATETIEDQIQDRGNMLASQQHPLTNPAAAIGISQSSGANLRKLAIRALNPDIQIPGPTGTFNMNLPYDKASPRIDNENSFLGLVKFCKKAVDTAVANKTLACVSQGVRPGETNIPFTDPDFAKYCGVVIPSLDKSVTLLTGEIYKGPVGVVVYKEDKDIAIENQKNNNYRYPRALPSLNSATYTGGFSPTDDSQPPVLAINSAMLNDILCRDQCKKNAEFEEDHSCGKCVYGGGTDIWSYVKQPPYGDTNEVSLLLIGNQYSPINVKVVINGTGEEFTSKSPVTDLQVTVVPLGKILEGSTFTITVSTTRTLTQSSPKAWIAGVLRGTNPDNSYNYLDLYNIITSDNINKGTPLNAGTKVLPDPERNVRGITYPITVLPEKDVPVMELHGEIPFTFVSSNWDETAGTQIGYYDCTSNPYVTSAGHFDYLSDDSCMKNPSNQDGSSTKPYSSACIQQLVLAAGCSTAGDWWNSPTTMPGTAGNAKRAAISSWLTQHQATATTNVADAKGCYGIDIGTPCDDVLQDPSKTPSKACLTYLYNNAGQNTSIGDTYETENFADVPNFRALNQQTDQYCRPDGKLNPANGNKTLETVWTSGYKDPITGNVLKGMEGVKKFLSVTYDSAVDNTRDINAQNNADTGGRANSWDDCFGIPIAKVPTNKVTHSIIGTGTPPATFKEICTPYTAGQNVYELAEVRSATSTWKNLSYENGAPPTGNGVMWIWGNPNGKGLDAANVDYTFRTNFCNPNASGPLIVQGGFDDLAMIYVNGEKIWSNERSPDNGNSGPITAQFKGGADPINKVAIYCKNLGGGGGSAAGVWLVIKDSKNNILCTTNSIEWRCLSGRQPATW